MIQARERAAPRQRSALTQAHVSLDSFKTEDSALETARQEAALWIIRRVPVSLVVARHIAELQGLGGRS